MKKYLILFLASILSSLSLIAQDPGYSIFDDSYLHEIRITFDDPDFWQTITDNYENASTGSLVPYLQGEMTIDGYTLDSIGVRQKGFASNFFVFGTKKPLKLDFNEFVSGQEFSGITKVNLGNGVGDPAIIKDKLAYDIMRFHGIPTPRVAHTKVYLNNTLWGTYALIEQVDKRYLDRSFPDNSGNLWKSMDNTQLQWEGTDPNDYPELALKTNETENDWTKMIEFLDVINNSSNANFKTDLEAIFEVDHYLRILAVDIIANNWDSYIDHGRNFYIYHQPKNDKMYWLPWDYNFSFDREPGFGGSDLDLIVDDPNIVLTKRMMDVPEFRQKFLSYICEVLEVNFTEERISSFIDHHFAIVNQDWDDASNNLFNSTQVSNALYANWFGDFSSTEGMNNYLVNRPSAIQSDLNGLGFTCQITPPAEELGTFVLNEIVAASDTGVGIQDQDGQYEDWIELFNNTDQIIDLSKYFLTDDLEFLKKWRMPENTFLLPNSYLIVWADKDIQQFGPHTSFKLEKNGEQLALTYIDGTIVDSISFTNQTTDQSWSRIPNGTGPFETNDLTHNAINLKVTSIDDIEEIDLVSVYPNPSSTFISLSYSGEADVITIADIQGKVLYSKGSPETSNITIDVSPWSKGMYVIQVADDKKFYTESFLVH